MSGWIYVLELMPNRCVKVGQTTDLPQRLTAHLTNAAVYGVTIARLASFAANDPSRSESDLLQSLRKHPRVTAVLGRETFAGIPFDEAVNLAKRQTRPGRAALGGVSALSSPAEFIGKPDHLTAIRAVLRKPREQMRDVLARLRERDAETYTTWNQGRLTRELEHWAIPERFVNGYRMVLAADVERAQRGADTADVAGSGQVETQSAS